MNNKAPPDLVLIGAYIANGYKKLITSPMNSDNMASEIEKFESNCRERYFCTAEYMIEEIENFIANNVQILADAMRDLKPKTITKGDQNEKDWQEGQTPPEPEGGPTGDYSG
jgi:hypothetical protein